MTKDEIVKRFRKVSWGRLYWKSANRGRWRDAFDNDDVCIVRDGGLTTHYKSTAALLEDIEQAEYAGKHPCVWINGDYHSTDGELTFEEIAARVRPDLPPEIREQLTVMYIRGHADKPSGILTRGQSVKVKADMRIEAVFIYG